MQFSVTDDVFARFPTLCVAVLVVTLPTPMAECAAALQVLRTEEEAARRRYAGVDLATLPSLAVWRGAFATLGINANRYRSSVEALLLRVLKGDALPDITPVVNLINAVSLRHTVPIGGHDRDHLQGALQVRFARAGETFIPFGATDAEPVDAGELVYADDALVRTRRWVWRQGNPNRVTAATTRIFIPIDCFAGQTDAAAHAAQADLATLLRDLLDADVELGWLTATAPALPFTDEVAASITPQPRSRRSLDAIDQVLQRAVVDVIVRSEVEKRMRNGDKLRVKLGIDPTGPRLHIGRAVALRKLRQFQQLGHTICLIIGDFTAMIGDASDKDAQRQLLSAEQVAQNMTTYKEQIARILDIDAVEWSFNNQWLGPLTFHDVIDLAKNFTVAQMIERENFRDRFQAGKPIGLHEFMYPLMQGYDSVRIHADLEVGGTDQLFNMMAGRTLQEAFGQRPQGVMTLTMVYGLDGRKMSTSWGNTVMLLDAPGDQYGKVMSMTDNLIVPYFEACTDVPLADIDEIATGLAAGDNPMLAKKRLAREIVALYHGSSAATSAQHAFERVVQHGEVPDDLPTIALPATPRPLVDVLVDTGLVPSKSEARRLIEQGGVTLDGDRLTDIRALFTPREGAVLRAGKRRYARLHVQ